MHRPIMEELEKAGSEADGGLLGLPETENELDNLTEFNTAQNRRISMLGIAKDPENFVKKKRKSLITFNEEEDVINPEDVDPSIGKFRNMIQSSIIPKATERQQRGFGLSHHGHDYDPHKQRIIMSRIGPEAELYEDEDPAMFSTTLSSSLGLSLPNPAPSVELDTSDDGKLIFNTEQNIKCVQKVHISFTIHPSNNQHCKFFSQTVNKLSLHHNHHYTIQGQHSFLSEHSSSFILHLFYFLSLLCIQISISQQK